MKQSLISKMWMMGTRLFTRLHGEQVGTDSFGNVYFQEKTPSKRTLYRRKRWVLYAGDPDATLVPPEWHAWLHYQTAAAPTGENPLRRPWQIEYQPNLTGTLQAYRPPGHTLRGERRAKATGDYEPWTPS